MSATTFLADMLVRLVSTVEKSVPIGVDVYSLVNTIAFITFFLDVNVHDARIKKFFENWSKQEKPLDVANKHPSARDVSNYHCVGSVHLHVLYVVMCLIFYLGPVRAPRHGSM